MRLVVAVLIGLAAGAPLGAQSPPKIPLVEGLTIVNAVFNPGRGDYESFLRVDKIDAEGVHVLFTGPRVKNPVKRNIRPQDLESSRHYLLRYSQEYPEVVPNTTGLGVSRATLRRLKTGRPITFSCCLLDGIPKERTLTGTLTRTGTGTVGIPVIVNDQPATLQAVRAQGNLGGQESDFYILDDAENPISLRWIVGRQHLTVVKISFPAERIATALAATGRAEVYGIYFDIGSATLRPESEPVLVEIGAALEKNPAWKLTVEGHTDNVGEDAANLELSNRRAEAVKGALVARFKIAAARLSSAGFGETRPKASNETIEGRARNRRVELVRQ